MKKLRFGDFKHSKVCAKRLISSPINFLPIITEYCNITPFSVAGPGGQNELCIRTSRFRIVNRNWPVFNYIFEIITYLKMVCRFTILNRCRFFKPYYALSLCFYNKKPALIILIGRPFGETIALFGHLKCPFLSSILVNPPFWGWSFARTQRRP